MDIRFKLGRQHFQSQLTNGVSLAIPMDFQGEQPNHFGAPKATSSVYRADSFVGDTALGGSCNVNVLSVIPHCNGTHTESVGHIVDQDVYVGHTTADCLVTAIVVTVGPRQWKDEKRDAVDESYRPPLEALDRVITSRQLKRALEQTAIESGDRATALIIRTIDTLPKKSVAYGPNHPPAFLTVQAMQWIVNCGFRHLLVDVPSVDRMFDDGLLTNHHQFWNVAQGQHDLNADTHQDKTITEMILVPEEVQDGLYILNLQIPALCTDAAPSRPVIYTVRPV